MNSNNGKYKEKFPQGSTADPDIAEAVRMKTVDGKIACDSASDIASSLHTTMGKVGATLDMLEIPITKCQLGLFGYEPKKSIVSPALTINQKLENAIRNNIANGCLPCEAAWEIAQEFALPKISVSSTCEALKIKIKPCQLGAF